MTLENGLGYSFQEKNLLTRALTRKAFALEQKQKKKDCDDQEIFRTLGDAVLKTILVDLLILRSGCKTRDEITSRKKKLEREEGLVPVSRKLKIGASIRFGKGEVKQKAEEEPYVLAETLEAVFGAIYLDGGFDASKEVITRLFEPYILNVSHD
jgi:ribonuclease-3